MKEELKAGKKPYKLQLVGMELGGKPIDNYAPDFWLVSPESGGDPVGFLTSPWWHPEKKTNIAMGYVPFDGTLNANGFPKGKVGTKYKVHLTRTIFRNSRNTCRCCSGGYSIQRVFQRKYKRSCKRLKFTKGELISAPLFNSNDQKFSNSSLHYHCYCFNNISINCFL